MSNRIYRLVVVFAVWGLFAHSAQADLFFVNTRADRPQGAAPAMRHWLPDAQHLCPELKEN